MARKNPCVIFSNELRASSLQFNRLVLTSLRFSFFVIKNDKGVFSFRKCVALDYKLELSNVGSILLHDFLCTFHLCWFRPKVATIETIIVICDICRWTYKSCKLNLIYRIPLHWIGAIKREGKILVEKFRFWYFNCGTTCFLDIPYFRSKLNEILKIKALEVQMVVKPKRLLWYLLIRTTGQLLEAQAFVPDCLFSLKTLIQ